MGYPTDKNGEACSAFHTGRDEDKPNYHSIGKIMPSQPVREPTQPVIELDDDKLNVIHNAIEVRRCLLERLADIRKANGGCTYSIKRKNSEGASDDITDISYNELEELYQARVEAQDDLLRKTGIIPLSPK